MGAAIVAAVWLSAAADAGTTHYALSRGLHEANPIVRAVGVEQAHWRIYPLKAFGAVSVIRATAKMKPVPRHITRGAVAALWTAVSVWNWKQIQQHGRR